MVDKGWENSIYAKAVRDAEALIRSDSVKQAQPDGTYEVVTRDELRRRHTAKTGKPTMSPAERRNISDLWVDFGKARHWMVAERVA